MLPRKIETEPVFLPENLPETQPVIVLDTPHVTPQEYARRTGLTQASVVRMIQAGRLPVLRATNPKDKGSQRGKRLLINLVALSREAMQQEW